MGTYRNLELKKETRKKYLLKNKYILSEYAKEYRKNNVEKFRERARKNYIKSREKIRESEKKRYIKNKNKIKYRTKVNLLKRNFNLTIEEYNKILIYQNFKCAICFKNQADLKRSLSVDHNHITKEVRGLLCINCNSLLGLSKDSPIILKQAVNYLETKGHYANTTRI